MMSLVFLFLNFLGGALLNAADRQMVQTGIMGSTMVLNIALNLALIPRFGIDGAAAAALVSNVFMFAATYVVIPRFLKVNWTYIAKIITQVGVAGALMGGVVCAVVDRSNMIAGIIAGALVYSVLLVVFRAVTKKQLDEAVRMLRS